MYSTNTKKQNIKCLTFGFSFPHPLCFKTETTAGSPACLPSSLCYCKHSKMTAKKFANCGYNVKGCIPVVLDIICLGARVLWNKI